MIGGLIRDSNKSMKLDLLKPYQPDSMRRHGVSFRVNSAQNDDPACAEEFIPETLF